jgi:hypothetical protein
MKRSSMRSLLSWLDPGKHPRVVIGPKTWLRARR